LSRGAKVLLLPVTPADTGIPMRPQKAPTLLFLALTALAAAGDAAAGRLGFQVNGEPIENGRAVLVAPGASVEVKLLPPPVGAADRLFSSAPGVTRIEARTAATAVWSVPDGEVELLAPDAVRWRPSGVDARAVLSASLQVDADSRVIPIEELRATSAQASSIAEGEVTFLVAMPFNAQGDGTLLGETIGFYPSPTAAGAPSVVSRNAGLYEPPVSFVRVDASTGHLAIGKHATLGALAPAPFDESGGRFVAISPGVIRLYDALHNRLARDGKDGGALQVIRGFLSPHERQRLEASGVRLAPYTRYQYGDALALILDRNADGRMDDVTADGVADIRDAEWLGGLVEEAMHELELRGGIGVCAAFEGPAHKGTPYVHVDLRGWNERWREE